MIDAGLAAMQSDATVSTAYTSAESVSSPQLKVYGPTAERGLQLCSAWRLFSSFCL